MEEHFPSHETFFLLVLLVVEIMSHFEERGGTKSYTLQEFCHPSLVVLIEESRVCLLHLALAYADL
jgi:hypothetical protein